MTTIRYAHPRGPHRPGDLVDVPDSVARRLVAGGVAVRMPVRPGPRAVKDDWVAYAQAHGHTTDGLTVDDLKNLDVTNDDEPDTEKEADDGR